jgi:hypothetical protein
MVLFELLALGAIGYGVRRHQKKKRQKKMQQQYGQFSAPPEYYPPVHQRDYDYNRSEYEPRTKPSYAHDVSPYSAYAERPVPSYAERSDAVGYSHDADRTAMEKGARAEPMPAKGASDSYGYGRQGPHYQ